MSTPVAGLSPAGPSTRPVGEAGFRPLRDWPLVLLQALQVEQAAVRVVVASGRGSVPRDAGVCMLVGADWFDGTIGGGGLEWKALAAARELLQPLGVPARLDRLVLAADLGQCCGGVVEIWLERFDRADLALLQRVSQAAHRGAAVLASTLRQGRVHRQLVGERAVSGKLDAEGAAERLLRAPSGQASTTLMRDAAGDLMLLERLDDPLPPVWLYGAGHVGQALARILSELPVNLMWIDSRAALLPTEMHGVRTWPAADPALTVAQAPAGTHFIVMTHSHALDYALCREILGRGDAASAGLIGSDSKAARFRSRLRLEGVTPERIAGLRCPIGLPGISGKWPAAIAVAVAAQLLQTPGLVAAEPADATDALPPQAACAGTRCATCPSPEAVAAGAARKE